MKFKMYIDVITTFEKLNALKKNWEAVYDADPEAHIFLSWPWISRRLQARISNWFVLAAKTDADASAYVAFFPLRYRGSKTPNGEIAKELAMAGNHAADYTGFLCMPEFTDCVISAFAFVIKKLEWKSLHLKNICAWNKNNIILLIYFPKNEYKLTSVKGLGKSDNVSSPTYTDNTICPYVDLPDIWENYLYSNLTSNMRRKIKRYLEAMEISGEFSITVSNDHTIDRDIDILLKFWDTKWRKNKGDKTDAMLDSLRNDIIDFFYQHILFMPILWRNEEPVGALACLVDDKKKSLCMYVAGRDAKVQKPPPGLLLNAYCIRRAIENGYKTYDFLRGNEPYKYLFGAKERSISYVRIEPKRAPTV